MTSLKNVFRKNKSGEVDDKRYDGIKKINADSYYIDEHAFKRLADKADKITFTQVDIEYTKFIFEKNGILPKIFIICTKISKSNYEVISVLAENPRNDLKEADILKSIFF